MTGRDAADRTRVEAEKPRPAGRAEAPRWMRFVIGGSVLLTVLLLAASLGMFLRSSGGDTTTPDTASVDVGFSQDMSVHHRQAILMAGQARDRSDDPAIRSLAFDIETNQLEQVGRMQGWLSLWNQAPLPNGKYMTWMPDDAMPGMAGMPGMSGGHDDGDAHGSAGIATMPGMASPAELERLRAASGKQLDVLFLQLMLRHHQGGVPMASYAAQHAETAQVRNLADKIVIAQSSEAEYLKQLLDRYGAKPLPPPA
jgi:uncharacterized protein (DUF305 family)